MIPPKKKRVDVFMFVDALGWKIVNRFDFLSRELPCRRGVQMQFGYSSTAIPTILSGRRPKEHGHLSFFYYSPQTSPFKIFSLLPASENPRALLNRGRVRNYLSKIFKFLKRYTGYFQLYTVPFDRLPYFDYSEKEDIFARHGLPPYKNLRDELEEAGLSYHISNWHHSETVNLTAAEHLMEKAETDFYFIYTAAMDALLHQHVKHPDIIARKLDFYAAHIHKMLETLKKTTEEFTFTVISDHGMTPLTQTADLKAKVEQLGLEFGRDYAACYDSTLFRVWFFTKDARQKIMNAVNEKTFPGHYVSEEDKKRYGIDFEDSRYGEEIFLLDPGCQIAPSDMGLKPLPGMHGFLPEDEDSTASILSTAEIPQNVKEVADFFGLMKARIGQLRSLKDAV